MVRKRLYAEYRVSEAPSTDDPGAWTRHQGCRTGPHGDRTCGCEVNSPDNRTCGVASLVPVLAARLPHVRRTCGCVVNLPLNRTCGASSFPVTSSGKSAPGTDPRIRHRIQIVMFRPIRVDHTNCLQVAIKTHSFIHPVVLLDCCLL